MAGDDVGIVVIDEDLQIDKDAELEARRAYLEEARSQEASSSDQNNFLMFISKVNKPMLRNSCILCVPYV